MTEIVEQIAGYTFHGRKGAVQNAFRYSVDYVMLDAEADVRTPSLFRRNARAVTCLLDEDHGGVPGSGQGAAWVREVLARYRVNDVKRIELLAQPRVLGHVFNPVSFWLCRNALGHLITVIAEVNNTYGDRHSYICFHEDHGAISPQDMLTAQKIFHVSPFQPVEGEYQFRFDIQSDQVKIWINYTAGNGGLVATLSGSRRPLTTWRILHSLVRRPFGARRVLALIHWQALKLWWKGAHFRRRPHPPGQEVTR
ncbi:MAG: DUF1365 domain-containing protein [Pseudomonadota bacterium]